MLELSLTTEAGALAIRNLLRWVWIVDGRLDLRAAILREREEGGSGHGTREKQIRTYAGIEGEIRKGTVREQALLIPGHTVTNFERGVHLRGCAFE